MGISHGSNTGAEVGSNGLKDYETARRNSPMLAHQNGEGHKGQQGHVIGDDHGDKEHQKHQHKKETGGGPADSQQLGRQVVQQIGGPKGLNHQHQAEEEADDLQVHRSHHQFKARTHHQQGSQSQNPGNDQHQVLFQDRKQLHT